jgi:hypothetical protein
VPAAAAATEEVSSRRPLSIEDAEVLVDLLRRPTLVAELLAEQPKHVEPAGPATESGGFLEV